MFHMWTYMPYNWIFRDLSSLFLSVQLGTTSLCCCIMQIELAISLRINNIRHYYMIRVCELQRVWRDCFSNCWYTVVTTGVGEGISNMHVNNLFFLWNSRNVQYDRGSIGHCTYNQSYSGLIFENFIFTCRMDA